MDQQTNDFIKKEIENNEVCLFMKGTPEAPQCGFSMAVSNILKILDIKFRLDKHEDTFDTIGKVSAARFIFDSGGSILVECVDYKKELTNKYGWIDSLLVTINSLDVKKVVKVDSPKLDPKQSFQKGNFVTIRPQQSEVETRPKF